LRRFSFVAPIEEFIMGFVPVLLALFPVTIVFLLLAVRKTPADIAGVIGWLLTVGIAWAFFETPLSVILLASLAGVIASFPITIMVGTSILQITVMQEAGAIARVVTLIKTLSPRDKVAQIMIINVGFGTLLAALGATPVSILPPIMIGLGYSSFAAIALPAIGYDALCTYALLGIPAVVFSGFVGAPVTEAGGYFARYMPVISTCIALGMLWIAGGWRLVRRGVFPAIVAGMTAGIVAIGMNAMGLVTITGIAAGVAVVVVMALYLLLLRKPVIDRAVMTDSDRAVERKMSLSAALSPWIILTAFALVVNAPFLPFFGLTFKTWAMPVTIVPGNPEKVRLFWQAYFWVLVSTVLALPFLRLSRKQLGATMVKWSHRALRPMLASAVFFAIALVMNHSGKTADWQLLNPARNMIAVLASSAANSFGAFYPAIAPFLGLFAGFVSGSEASAIAMLTKLHLETAGKIGAVGLVIAAASGIGGGLASVISPAKLQNAAAAIDRIGEEGSVIRTTFVISLIITAVCAIMTLFWAF